MKDWTGNKRTLGALLGASNHTSEDRQREDYYATHPDMVRDLLNAGAPLRQQVWEPACGAGHIVNVLRERGHEVYATDIVDRGCPDSSVLDFLWEFAGAPMGDVDIMTNPPYATALEFVERALRLVKPGANVWMLLKLSFLEGKGRKRLFNDTPPADVWVFSVRKMAISTVTRRELWLTHGSTGSKAATQSAPSNGYELQPPTDAFLIMEFINIPTALFSSPEYIGAEPIQRATWISLLAWCCEQENGGIIEGCRSWGMRRWMQTCGVTDQEISAENELYHFDGDNLVVFGYPHEIQDSVQTRRKTARENGKLGGRPRKTDIGTSVGTEKETHEKPTSVISENPAKTKPVIFENPEENPAKTVRKEGRKEGIHPLTPSPCTVEEVEAHLRDAAFAGRVRLTPDQIPDCATAYWGSRDAVNWTRSGIPVTRWQSDAVSFATSYAVNHPPPPGNGDKDPYSNFEEL